MWLALKSLTPLVHVTIFVTVFGVPASFEMYQGWQSTGLCLSCVDWVKATLYLAWYFVAVVVTGLAMRVDRSRLEARFDRSRETLGAEISRIREKMREESFEVGDQVSDLKHQVDYLDGAVRAVFEKLEMDLPPMPLYARSRATLRVRVKNRKSRATLINNASKMAMFFSKIRRTALRFLRWVWDVLIIGKP